MNERITKLAMQASDPKTGWLDRQKFAELIIRECIDAIGDHQLDLPAIQRIKARFGIAYYEEL